MPTCKMKGIEISYLKAGQQKKSDKSIIFIHGAGGSAERWSNQLLFAGLHLKDNYFSLAIDLPGHGDSGGEACGQIFLYREWIKEFIDIMELDRNIIIGHSMGGAIAIDFSLKYPHLVDGLFIISSGVRFQIAQQRLEAYKNGDYLFEWVRDGFATATNPSIINRFYEMCQKCNNDSRYLDFLACSRFKADNLNDIQKPTYVICGKEDINTPPNLSQYIVDNIKNSQLILIENAAHQVMLEKPDEINKIICDFLRQL